MARRKNKRTRARARGALTPKYKIENPLREIRAYYAQVQKRNPIRNRSVTTKVGRNDGPSKSSKDFVKKKPPVSLAARSARNSVALKKETYRPPPGGLYGSPAQTRRKYYVSKEKFDAINKKRITTRNSFTGRQFELDCTKRPDSKKAQQIRERHRKAGTKPTEKYKMRPWC